MTETGNSVPMVNEVAKQVLLEQRKTAVDLADAMSLSSDSGYKLLRRSDWRISEMLIAGKFLNFNFFELFVPKKDNADASEKLKAKEDELNALKHKMELMEQENRYLKELVEMAKMKLKG